MLPERTHKRCSVCNEVKHLTQFNRKYDDYQSSCKECRNKHHGKIWLKLSNLASKCNARASERITTYDLFLLFIAQNGRCVYSNLPLEIDNISIDHIVNIDDNGNNNIDNLVFCHMMFNLSRSNIWTIEEMCSVFEKSYSSILSRFNSIHSTWYALQYFFENTYPINLREYAKQFDN